MKKIEINQIQTRIPQEFVNFVTKKLEKNGEGGRPDFSQQSAKENYSVIQETLNILENRKHKQNCVKRGGL